MTDRAVSVTLDYVILFAIAAVVLAGVATVSGAMISGQVESGVENELEATGERLAADIQDVERLVNTTDPENTTLRLESDLPRHVSGENYRITIGENGDELILYAPSPGIEVTTPVAAGLLNESAGSISGGAVVIEYDDGEEHIEVREA